MNKLASINLRLFSGILLLCTSFHFSSNAQDYNQTSKFLKANSKWVFGHDAALDFNGGLPVPFTMQNNNGSGGYAIEGAATASDPVTGNLLFYSSGLVCRNANGNVMPNGSDLMGNHSSTTQATCIVPMIDSPGKYYLFNLTGLSDFSTHSPFGTLFYSIVDMNLDGGQGDIEPGRKNVLLWNNGINGKDSLAESMIAIPGEHCDIWLLLHKSFRPEFVAYHITAAGIDPNPVISVTGTNIQGGPYLSPGGSPKGAFVAGGLSVSPNRRMVTIASSSYLDMPGMDGTLLCRFDPATGIASDAIELGPDKIINNYVSAFSPDNTRLYVGFNEAPLNTPTTILQYTIDTYDSAAIAATRTQVGSFALLSSIQPYLKLYDGKIYINNGVQLYDDKIAVIHNPNAAVPACNFDANAITLLSGTYHHYQLPNELVYPHRNNDTLFSPARNSTLCQEGSSLSLSGYANGINYIWDDGSTNKDLVVTQPGTYWVFTALSCGNRIDTFVVKQENIHINLGPDTTLCTGSGQILLDPGKQPGIYQWQDGSTTPTFLVKKPGTYRVQMTLGDCHAEDAIQINANCSCMPFIPNAFSPNGDGKNDAFTISVNCPVERYNLNIYNRFGQRVFHGENSWLGWDGTYEGNPCEIGTYYYYVTYNARFISDAVTRKGNITLVR